MISAVDISLQFGGRSLFKNVSFRIGPLDRIGLVGSNGTGKTTLLRILVGEQTPERGEIARAKYVTVGYLPQEGMSVAGRTLYAEVESVFADVLDVQAGLEEIHRRLSTVDQHSEECAELLDMAGELQHRLESSDAFRMETEITKVLAGLGFAETDLQRLTDEFSGGWQMRIALAKLLLRQPSLLLLDEPTNHLDLDSLQWLEEYLRDYQGAVMIVSHDRRFLDNMTRRTYELSLGALTEYAGNFSFYIKEREVRKQLQRAALKNQQQQIKQTEQFIERFRYKATKARQVQSRIKQLDKLERIEIEDEEESIHFSFPPSPQSGRTVMELKGIRKHYGALTVFRGIDFDIDREDHVAFVGANGAGKSTLARIIAGVEPFDGGERVVGHNVTISYFAQHQAEELNPRNDVLATVDEVATGDIRKRLRTLLGCFLFSGDDVFKKVSVLSGGEKSRLALAKMLLQPSNLLVMDEPTNHLDVRSKGVLQDALTEYEGSFVIVSHDRDFLDPIVTKVIEFRLGSIKTYLGNVSEFIDAKKREKETSDAVAAISENSGRSQMTEKERKRLEAEERQRLYKKTRPLQEAVNTIERELEALEKEKTAIERTMTDPEFYKDGEKVKLVSARYKELKDLVTDAYFRWNERTKELDVVRASMETKERKQ